MIFSVLLPGEGSEEIAIFWEWDADKGKKYSFVLTGSREEGYSVRAAFAADRTELMDLLDGALS